MRFLPLVRFGCQFAGNIHFYHWAEYINSKNVNNKLLKMYFIVGLKNAS